MSAEKIKKRAEAWRSSLNCGASVEPSQSAIGGGSLPGETLATWVLALPRNGGTGAPEEIMRRLRESEPPVMGRVEEDRVLFDPRTVSPEEEDSLLGAVRAALAI